MSSIFTQIIEAGLPARFIWKDPLAVAFLTIEPRQPGHTLVVPRVEVDRWIDVSEELMAHLMSIAHKIGLAQREEWDSDRVGLMIEGYMVPHLHIHVWPSWSPREFHPSGIDRAAEPHNLDEAARRLRARMRAQGNREFVPDEQ
jgi:histidine triad (HIT) family protein